MIKHDGIFLKKLMARHKWICKNQQNFRTFVYKTKYLSNLIPKGNRPKSFSMLG